MMKFLKFASVFLAAAALLFSTASLAQAQPVNQWWLSSPLNQYQAIKDSPETEVNFQKYLYSTTNTIIGYINNGIVAPEANAPSATSGLGRAIAAMTGNPPVRTAQYLAYMGAKAGFVEQAYAQDGGFGVLAPVRDIWIATRNVAYLVTSLTLVVIGFMIMMRRKLDAQTVIGIQQALPSIVITLLLITFSYAIAGLMIDLLYFVLYFVIRLLGNNIFTDNGSAALEAITTTSIFGIGLQGLFGFGSGKTAADAIAALINNVFSSDLTTFIGGALGGLIGTSGIGGLIVSGALLFATVKIFFSLLTSYAMFLIATIFGPLMLMTNAVPGSNSFGTWIKNLAGNAAVFPATAIFLILAAALMGTQNTAWGIKGNVGFSSAAARGEVAWLPPLLFGANATASNPQDALMAIIGLGMFMLTPQFIDMVKKAFQTAGGEGAGSAIGQALRYGVGGPFSPVGAATRLGSRHFAQQQQMQEEKAGWGREEEFRALLNPKYTPQPLPRTKLGGAGRRLLRTLTGV